MDLSNFPTKESAKQMLSMVSPIYDNSYVGKWIFEIMGLYFDEIMKLIKGLRDELNPETATWTLPYWAEEYGVDTDQDEDIVRSEVTAKHKGGYPMNPERIRRIAEKLTGRVCDIAELNGTGIFEIIIKQGADPVPWRTVIEGLDKRKQAHLSYRFRQDIEEELKLGHAVNVKENKVISPDESSYEPYDPLGDIILLADEEGNILTDEEGNFLAP